LYLIFNTLPVLSRYFLSANYFKRS
jgi:hypothetical protein